MTADLTNAFGQRLAEDGRFHCHMEEKLEPVLQQMLAALRRHRETPLLAGFDGVAIVYTALQCLSTGTEGSAAGQLCDLQAAIVAFNRLIERALLDESVGPSSDVFAGGDAPRDTSATAGKSPPGEEVLCRALAAWLENFHALMREVHPKSVEIVSLRVDGYKSREVARRLELTPRIVKRILRDLRQAWQSAAQKE